VYRLEWLMRCYAILLLKVGAVTIKVYVPEVPLRAVAKLKIDFRNPGQTHE